jgi:hypothetical protein
LTRTRSLAWIQESKDNFEWKAIPVPGSTTEFQLGLSTKGSSQACIGPDGIGIFTVYGRISVVDLHFLGVFGRAKKLRAREEPQPEVQKVGISLLSDIYDADKGTEQIYEAWSAERIHPSMSMSRFFLDDKDLDDTFENFRDGASVVEKFMERELNHGVCKR